MNRQSADWIAATKRHLDDHPFRLELAQTLSEKLGEQIAFAAYMRHRLVSAPYFVKLQSLEHMYNSLVSTEMQFIGESDVQGRAKSAIESFKNQRERQTAKGEKYPILPEDIGAYRIWLMERRPDIDRRIDRWGELDRIIRWYKDSDEQSERIDLILDQYKELIASLLFEDLELITLSTSALDGAPYLRIDTSFLRGKALPPAT